jgi:hypothetical protein
MLIDVHVSVYFKASETYLKNIVYFFIDIPLLPVPQKLRLNTFKI